MLVHQTLEVFRDLVIGAVVLGMVGVLGFYLDLIFKDQYDE